MCSGARGSWFAIALAVALAACSSPSSQTADAGRVPDAGSAGDGGADGGAPAKPQAIGGACQRDADCLSGHCDRQTASGYCTEACAVNTDCPAGSACEQVTHGSGYCVRLCQRDSDCRTGFACKPIYVECLPQPGCQSNLDCPHQHACDSGTGLCEGALGNQADIGEMCRQTSDCGQGPRPYCLSPQDGFPNGYCTSMCHTDSECGPSHLCVGGLVSGNSGLALCMASCAKDSDCRSQYVCATGEQRPFCAPACHSDTDCFQNGETCDASTGHCSAPPVPDGGSADAGSPDGGGPDAGEVDAGSPDAGGGYTGGYPAPHPRVPQVIDSGGPVLGSPRFVPVFFSNDDMAEVAAIAGFDGAVGSSAYWKATTEEYGVGPGAATAPVVLDEVATGSLVDSGIQTWLASDIQAGKLPPSDANTLYVLHYPASVTISLQGQLSCEAFGAYHSEAKLADGTSTSYAVVPRCSDPNGSAVDAETASESHEMVEAATDALPFSHPAWSSIDDAHVYWPYALGGDELADLCAQEPGVFVKLPDFPYAVQRSWSNESASAGKDPCVPETPGEVFFNAVPELPDQVQYDLGGGHWVATLGVAVPPGGSRTIPLDLYSEADTGGPWRVKVVSASSFGQGPGTFTYTLDRSTGENGDRLMLTVQASAQASLSGPDIFYVVSENAQRTTYWLGLAASE